MFGICKIQIHIRFSSVFSFPKSSQVEMTINNERVVLLKISQYIKDSYICLIMRKVILIEKKETNISQILKLKNSPYNVLLWCSHYYLFSPVTKSPNMVNLLMTFATKLLLSSIRTVQTNGCPSWLQPVWTRWMWACKWKPL